VGLSLPPFCGTRAYSPSPAFLDFGRPLELEDGVVY
jgi:hypothetical protein